MGADRDCQHETQQREAVTTVLTLLTLLTLLTVLTLPTLPILLTLPTTPAVAIPPTWLLLPLCLIQQSTVTPPPLTPHVHNECNERSLRSRHLRALGCTEGNAASTPRSTALSPRHVACDAHL